MKKYGVEKNLRHDYTDRVTGCPRAIITSGATSAYESRRLNPINAMLNSRKIRCAFGPAVMKAVFRIMLMGYNGP